MMNVSEANDPAIEASGNQMEAQAPPWYRRIAFWRAIAGMALAVALAAVAVMLETSSELSTRSAAFHRRLARMSSRISAMRGEIMAEDREIISMRVQIAARDTMNRILAQPDATLIRLAPITKGADAIGLVALSRRSRRAVIEVAGLPAPASGQSYVLWWTSDHGPAVKAAQFHTGPDERAAVVAQLPLRNDPIMGAIVTAESDQAPQAPSGAVTLKSIVETGRPKPGS